MSIVPASRLSASDLALLGNNLTGPARHRPARCPHRRRLPAYRGELTAVNRSLAAVGERIGRLLAPATVTPACSGA
jgi:hypothetical protein